ncbi:MAG: hypothetical protein JWM58_1497 [Rhizobium sp.]|nr:hypothetical protein [Rhizobium sp.]
MAYSPRDGRRLPHGGVDRNVLTHSDDNQSYGRLPNGGVDRNSLFHQMRGLTPVASRTGAWIETPARPKTASVSSSPHARGRGSKHVGGVGRGVGVGRLPHGGVDRNGALLASSHFRMRRLPHGGVDRNLGHADPLVSMSLSPPARGRGSKPIYSDRWRRPASVASRTGAWIETTDSGKA